MNSYQKTQLHDLIRDWNERSEKYDFDDNATESDFERAYAFGVAADELSKLLEEMDSVNGLIDEVKDLLPEDSE